MAKRAKHVLAPQPAYAGPAGRLVAAAALRSEGRAFAQIAELVGREPPPRGRVAALPGRGEMYVRVQRGPAGAPAVVLLHGWIASGGLNWFQVFEPLRERYRVIAPDLRGHGRGIRSRSHFRLRDCADDVAALLRKRRIRNAVVVGYSMGGTIAQLLWRWHPEVVGGLVLAATSARPMRNPGLGLTVMGLMEGAALAGRALRRRARPRADVALPDGDEPISRMVPWARGEVRRHDWRHLLEAGAELGRYDATRWIGDIDVPTSIVVTDRDAAFPIDHQLAMAERIRGARVHELTGGHLSFAKPSFGTAIRTAVDCVAKRAARRGSFARSG